MAARKEKTVAAILTAETGQLKREMTRAGGMVTGFAGKVERASTRMRMALRNVGFGNVTSRLRSMGGSIAAIAGVYGIGKVISDIKDFEAGLTDLGITGNKSNVWLDQTRKKIMEVSSKYAIGRNDVLAYVQTLVTLTGKADMARNTVETMGKVAAATGTNMQDLASMMALLSNSMGITADNAYKVLNILPSGSREGWRDDIGPSFYRWRESFRYCRSVWTGRKRGKGSGRNVADHYAPLWKRECSRCRNGDRAVLYQVNAEPSEDRKGSRG
jgi:hypothetical protein